MQILMGTSRPTLSRPPLPTRTSTTRTRTSTVRTRSTPRSCRWALAPPPRRRPPPPPFFNDFGKMLSCLERTSVQNTNGWRSMMQSSTGRTLRIGPGCLPMSRARLLRLQALQLSASHHFEQLCGSGCAVKRRSVSASTWIAPPHRRALCGRRRRRRRRRRRS